MNEVWIKSGSNIRPVEETEDESRFEYPSSEYYVRLGNYLNQLFGVNMKNKKILDLACGTGGGVLYLRDRYGIDAIGIDLDLTRHWERPDWARKNQHFERINELYRLGVLIEDDVANVDQHFQANGFDALTCVYFSHFEAKKTNVVNSQKNTTKKLDEILKEGGFQLQIMMDSSSGPSCSIDIIDLLLHIPHDNSEYGRGVLWTLIGQKTN